MGGPVDGRDMGGEARAITPDELAWLKKAVPRLILRAAEVESLPHPLPTLRTDSLEGGSLWGGRPRDHRRETSRAHEKGPA